MNNENIDNFYAILPQKVVTYGDMLLPSYLDTIYIQNDTDSDNIYIFAFRLPQSKDLIDKFPQLRGKL